MKKKEEVRSFKDNLKSLLLRHSFRPALQMEIICILLVVVIGGWWGIASNREANSHVCEALEQTITVYGELLDQLSAEDHIINPETSLTRRTLILKSLYTASARAGYEANMYILDPEGNILVSSRETVSDEEKVLVRNWNILEQLKESPEQIQMGVSRGSSRTLLLAKAVVADGRIQGSIVMQVGGSVYDKLLAANAGKTVIAQKDYWVLDTNGYQFVDPIGRLVNSMRESQGLKIFEKGIYYVRHQEVGGGNLEVYTFFDYTDTVRVLAMVLLTGIVVLAFLFFAGLSNTEKMAVKATEDISTLNEAFLAVTEGDLRAHLEIHSSTEFKNIGNGFNQMIRSLNRQMEENRELAEIVAEEQVKRLASQFSSHFLFNTLDNIRFICRIAPEIAENMVILLSELLRYNTANPNERVTIAEDLDYIEKYFEIFKIRVGDGFDYKISVEEDIKECLILRLLVQPIVENAMKYAQGSRENMKVSVKAYRSGEDICIECKDNGEGMSPELLQKLQENLEKQENETAHLGLYNVHRRLQLTYGEKYGIRLENCEGLRVTVTFPAQTEEPLEEY